jgi:hypothetical protein
VLAARAYNPTHRSAWFGLFRVRSPLLAESFLFLRVLRCFSSPGSLCKAMYSPCSDQSSSGRVSPFGHHRLVACTRLPDAFRSVPRPSSALDARASPVRLFSLRSVMRRPRSSLLADGEWLMADSFASVFGSSLSAHLATFFVRLLSRTLTRFLVIEILCHSHR